MKLLLVFAFLALVCMARSAPSSTPGRLILPDYLDADEEVVTEDTNTHDEEDQEPTDEDNEDDEDTTTTTTTTTTSTTTRRSSYMPTRNRNSIPTRRPFLTPRTTVRTTTTTTGAYDEEEDADNDNQYDGDFKYIRDFRKYVQKLLEDIRKLVRNLTGYDLMNNQRRQQYQYQNTDDD